ncbi:MAG: FecR domain-containing protein [Odoribacteraceae bacterium]|jgi:ferric-dicitrate binding protein FerR (iron transport regulator)|nr:FecR domain-containing protein [Odoribacteraceae bacterium]
MTEQESIRELILLHLQGELDEEGQRQLERWRKDSPRHEETFQRVTSMKHAEEGLARFILPEREEEEAWQRLRREIAARSGNRRGTNAGRTGRRRVSAWSLLARVSVIALLLAAGWVVYHLAGERSPSSPTPSPSLSGASPVLILPDGSRVNLGDEESIQTLADALPGLLADEASLTYHQQQADDETGLHLLRVPRGGEYMLILSDSTVVHLNAESELSYPATFAAGRRDVFLKGEAYFNVRADARRPFTVHAGGARVEVLGTAFGVRAYGDEPAVHAILERGKIKLLAGNRSLLLAPNTRASYNKESNEMTLLPADPALFLGWREGRLVYDNAPLEEILGDIGRRYCCRVLFQREETRTLPFSINIKRPENVNEVLRLLEDTRRVRFDYRDSTIIIP